MKKIVFLIPNLMHGGAERVLVNLVNHLNPELFDVTLVSLFDCGVNRKELAPQVHYRFCYPKQFRGNSHYFKLFSPGWLYRRCIGEGFDIAVAFLEGVAARIVSGCPFPETRTVCWIHTSLVDPAVFAQGFRSAKEAGDCYGRFDRIVCVSQSVRRDFQISFPSDRTAVLYNPLDEEKIRRLAKQSPAVPVGEDTFALCAVGKLIAVKGFDRLIRVMGRLVRDGEPVRLYLCGCGEQEARLRQTAAEEGISDRIVFAGFLENPYAVLARCRLFVCSSLREGFSSAAAEALICGVPVATVQVQGMNELLGDPPRGGVICDNNEDSLYFALRQCVSDAAFYDRLKQQAQQSGGRFSLAQSVRKTEELFLSL